MPDTSSMVTTGAVFLSYAHEDRGVALCIAGALHHHGIEVWLDQAELGGGDAWDQKIRRQIRECALFVPIISQHTQERSEGYFRREWKMGIERTHDLAEDVAFIVPVVIDDTLDSAARVPEKFREVQWTRLPRGEVPGAFAERVRRLLGKAREPVVRVSAVSAQSGVELKQSLSPLETLAGWRPVAGAGVPGTAWILEEKLGAGGFGEVWLGRHAAMKERRVFKFCFRTDRVRSLKRELTLFRVIKERVGAHPNIVRLLDVHFDNLPVYLEMDYVAGESLKVWCEQQGGMERVPLAVRLELIAQVADALHAAHAAGVLHRDVKPGNILIEQTAMSGAPPIAKLSDFGIGQVMSGEILAGMTQAGFTQSVVAEYSPQSGTQLYMAPELLAGEAATAQSDIYSLGVVLFQLIIGNLHRPLTTDWPRAIDDPCLREDLGRCFAGNPRERFATAGLLAESLRALPQRRAASAALEAKSAARRRRARRWKIGLVVGGAAGALVLAAGLVRLQQRDARQRWAREVALPEIERLADGRDYPSALELARRVEHVLPADPVLLGLLPRISAAVSIATTPPGAEVYAKEYRQPESPWELVGTTPLSNLRMPRGFYRWDFRLPGYAIRTMALDASGSIEVSLDRADAFPPEMVRVQVNTTNSVRFSASTGLQSVELTDYLIDRYEVSNRQYQDFVNRGGYSKPVYWKNRLVRDERELTWEEAMDGFRDTTGRTGPATWANGVFPEGTADYPVTGVSWYEAAAYAEFAGKRLPSVYHWRWAALIAQSESIPPLSNFGSRGLAPVGTFQGMSQWGAYDMAGNAKEWCWNEADPGKRYILGGGWSEPDYMYGGRDALSAFSRSSLNGFRCIRIVSPTVLAEKIDAPVVTRTRDIANARPVSDEVFRTFASQFSYDKTPLQARLESVDDSDLRWRKEKVTFDAAYGGERMACYLFLPRGRTPPFQAVVYFPGSTALLNKSSQTLDGIERFDFLVERGRAIIYPVYKGTYERGADPWRHPWPRESIAYRDWMLQLSKDLGRTIDYLETRSDLRSDKLAYLGSSWGAVMGSILSALEQRLTVNVFVNGGLYAEQPTPEADQVNFAPRITIPTLMMNGRYDFTFPLEKSQRPLFALLGTAPEQKRHLLFDTGHGVPRDQYTAEVLGWLDRYLGQVK